MLNFTFRNPFRTPSAKELAVRELEASERGLLAAHSQAEYGASMVDYHTKQIARLKGFIPQDKQ